MLRFLTPARQYAPEYLDDPALDRTLVVRTLHDIRRSNVVFGARRAMLAACEPLFTGLPSTATVLDIGTGLGDIPAHLARAAARRGITLRTVGTDILHVLAQQAESTVSHTVCADALALPFANRSVDLVICSQLLHHFRSTPMQLVIREMNRVARHAVVISDLRRCRTAAGGFWLASFPLGFHPITRHDGVVSVMRGFTSAELTEIIERTVAVRPCVHRRLGFRLTASWRPST